MAGDTNMAVWGFIPELAASGVELHLIALHAEWNISLDQWQWDSMGIWVAGPMPRPGKSISMMAHARYGMMHPYALDGKTDNRGYTAATYIIAYDVPLLEDVVEEAQSRELTNWMREHMEVYPSGVGAGGACA